MPAALAADAASATFEPIQVVRTAMARLGSTPSALVLFTGRRGSGELADTELRKLKLDFPCAVIESPGVLSSAGEVEAEGVAAIAFGRERLSVEIHGLAAEPPRAIASIAAAARGTILLGLVLAPPLYGPEIVASARTAPGAVVGGGAARVYTGPRSDAMGPVGGIAIAVSSSALRAAQVASPAAKILTPYRKLTEVQGNFLIRADDQSVLEWFTTTPGTQTEGSPTFIATRAKNEGEPPLLQTLVGMDPRKGAVAVREPIELGREIAVGVWNGEAARQDLVARVGSLSRMLSGGMPVAGLFMTCLGRGQDLFGAADVDTNAFSSRFPGVPFAGMFSQFEIAKFDGVPRVHLYTASIAVLYRPS